MRTRAATFLLAAIAAAACAACSASGGGDSKAPASATTASSPSVSQASTFSLTITLTLYGDISTTEATPATGLPCFGISNGSQNFEDIVAGATVKVLDGGGSTIAVGQLGAGTLGVVDVPTRECSFPLEVDEVPASRGIYSLVVGTHSGDEMAESAFKTQSLVAFRSITYGG